ncbi:MULTISPECIES: hypothetical protein [Vibrio]|uniref:hypothetical protein n=1 Tax=Vibrio TaxID=662 RepID=UPI0012684C94|nr:MULTISPECIES: hypothetical protein [Vibrio]MCG9660607.1 hypothetical protein [Vibrio mediterranei]
MRQKREKRADQLSVLSLKRRHGTTIIGRCRLSMCHRDTKLETSGKLYISSPSSSTPKPRCPPKIAEQLARFVLLGVGTEIVRTVLFFFNLPVA